MTTKLQTPSSPLKKNPKILIREIPHTGWTEYFLTASVQDCTPKEWIKQVEHFLSESNATAIESDVFGSESFLRSAKEFASWKCPWSFLSGRLSSTSSHGGFLVHAITGVSPSPLYVGDQMVGFSFQDSLATHAFLSNISPSNITASEGAQTEKVFEMFETSLKQVGMNFRHVTRTWFYLNQILDWYSEFNRVRTAFFESRNVFGGIMPASTGVGAANLSGSALLTKAYAILPKSDSLKISAIDSPLQCSAYKYGSAFSRALEVEDLNSRSLFISGTASIEPGGKTVHVGNVSKQIELSLEVVEAILKSRSMSWSDTVRAIAYFRNEADISLWSELGGEISSIPCIATQCDVCRDDLLFEIELQACAKV